jgi:hypothetical protein
LFIPHKLSRKNIATTAPRVNLPDFSENNFVIEDATTLITISETFSQPESINSQPETE